VTPEKHRLFIDVLFVRCIVGLRPAKLFADAGLAQSAQRSRTHMWVANALQVEA
jgi:hypothetical protein